MKLYRPIIEDDIELCDADGKNAKKLHYRIDVNRSYKAITAKRSALAAQADIVMQTGDEQALEKLGETFLDLMVEVFGEQTTNELTEWYGDASNLVWLVTPVLIDTIFPALDTQREQVMRLKEIGNRYAVEQEAVDGD